MAITKSTQDWTLGSTVKIGFMSLIVRQLIPTPGDYRPDRYILEGAKGQHYSFTPHHGLEKCDGIEYGTCSVCRREQVGKRHEHVCE